MPPGNSDFRVSSPVSLSRNFRDVKQWLGAPSHVPAIGHAPGGSLLNVMLA